MKIRLVTSGAASLLLLAVYVSTAHAAPITFIGADAGAASTDPRPNSDAAAASFDAAVALLGPVNLITFETAPVGSFSSLTVAAGVTLTATTGEIRNTPFASPDFFYGYNTTPAGSRFVSTSGGVTFTFSNPVQAFGAYLGGLQGATIAHETITFFDGSSQTVDIPDLSTGIAFVGFIDGGAAISSISINLPGQTAPSRDIASIDDVRYVTSPAAIPEPTSLFLLGAGLLGAAARRFRS